MIRQIAPTNGRGNGEDTLTLMMKRQPVEGWLEKKNKRLGWSKRKVTLEGEKLVYSNRVNSSTISGEKNKSKTKEVQLKDINSVTCRGRILEICMRDNNSNTDNKGNKDNNPNNEIVAKIELRASTEVDAFSWVQNLNLAIANAKTQVKTKNSIGKKRVSLHIDTSSPPATSTEPELEFPSTPLTPQSSFSIASSGSFSGSFPPSLQRAASFDDQGEYVKKLWEKRTLQRRRTQSVRNVQWKDSDCSTSTSAKSTGTTVNIRRTNSDSKNIVKAVKRNIVETGKRTTKQNNKMIAFLSGLVAKFLSPFFQVFSKSVNVENKEELKILLNRAAVK